MKQDLCEVDPPLARLVRELKSYGPSGRSLLDTLPSRYGKPYEIPYWRFFFDEPVKDFEEVPTDARRVWISAKARDFGKITRFSALEAVCVSDFSSETAATLAQLPKLKCVGMWGGALVDLKCLSEVPAVEVLIVFGAPKLTALEGIEHLTSLRTLHLAGIPKVTKLDPIGALGQLEGLELKAGIVQGTLADRTKFDSLKPLSNLRNLKVLRLWGFRVADDDLGPVASLSQLAEIEVGARVFPLQSMAVAAAAFPALRDEWSRPLGAVAPCRQCGAKKQMLAGRGTRDICPNCHPERLERFHARFNQMVDKARGGGTIDPA